MISSMSATLLRLRCFENPWDEGYLDARTGKLTCPAYIDTLVQSLAQALIPASTRPLRQGRFDGWYSRVFRRVMMLYRYDAALHFRFMHDAIRLEPGIRVLHERIGRFHAGLRIVRSEDGKLLFTCRYRLLLSPDMVLAGRATCFEDADFGLFVASVWNNTEERARLLGELTPRG